MRPGKTKILNGSDDKIFYITKSKIYQHQVKISHFDYAKAPGLNDRKWVHIDLILTHLRSLNRGSFRVSPNVKF